MNLGVNPLLQFGLEETRRQLCENILNDLAVVNYVPFDSDTIGNPALDVGDILSFTGGQADATKYACITSNSIKIGGRQSIKCVGKNPKLSQAKSKNDKNISGLLAQIEAGKIGIHNPTKANGGRIRNLPEHDPEKWSRFKAYNARDVETEMQIQQRLVKFPVPVEVWDEYHIDQEINDGYPRRYGLRKTGSSY